MTSRFAGFAAIQNWKMKTGSLFASFQVLWETILTPFGDSRRSLWDHFGDQLMQSCFREDTLGLTLDFPRFLLKLNNHLASFIILSFQCDIKAQKVNVGGKRFLFLDGKHEGPVSDCPTYSKRGKCIFSFTFSTYVSF